VKRTGKIPVGLDELHHEILSPGANKAAQGCNGEPLARDRNRKRMMSMIPRRKTVLLIGRSRTMQNIGSGSGCFLEPGALGTALIASHKGNIRKIGKDKGHVDDRGFRAAVEDHGPAEALHEREPMKCCDDILEFKDKGRNPSPASRSYWPFPNPQLPQSSLPYFSGSLENRFDGIGTTLQCPALRGKDADERSIIPERPEITYIS